MLLRRLARLWRADDGLPPSADLIVAISFGASKEGLSKASQRVLARARWLRRKFPKALVAFGAHHLPDPVREAGAKLIVFPDAVYAGATISSIDEAEKIRSALPANFTPTSIVVVTEAWHSRSARFVWRRVWRNNGPAINISTIRLPKDPENPMRFQRSEKIWAVANVLRHAVLIFPGGYSFLKKTRIRQPTSGPS